MHPSQDCTTLIPNCRYSSIPSGLRLLNRSSRKKPATVGGRTIGSVRMPSRTDFLPGPAYIRRLAARIPRKNERIVATTPVLREIHSGLQSSPRRISSNPFMVTAFHDPEPGGLKHPSQSRRPQAHPLRSAGWRHSTFVSK